jgi:hypothetical protein
MGMRSGREMNVYALWITFSLDSPDLCVATMAMASYAPKRS